VLESGEIRRRCFEFGYVSAYLRLAKGAVSRDTG
jgi:hypothetical protein